MKNLSIRKGLLLAALVGLGLGALACKQGREAEVKQKASGAAPAAQEVQAVQRPEISIEHCSG